MGEIRCKRGLGIADDEQIWKPAGVQTVQRSHSIRPFVTEFQAASVNQIISATTGVVGTDFEPRRKDDAVQLNQFAVGNNSPLGNFIDTLAISINQVNVVPVKSRQIVIMETGPLTKLP